MISNEKYREVSSRTRVGTLVMLDPDVRTYEGVYEVRPFGYGWPYDPVHLRPGDLGITLDTVQENNVQVLFGDRAVLISRFSVLEVL